MRTASLLIGVVVLGPAPALAASTVAFTIALGGDNHTEAWEAGVPQLFTPGDTADWQVFEVGDVITWDVRIAVYGTHEQPGHPAHGYEIQGAANIVQDLSLHEGSAVGPLATDAVFFSSINDGDGGDIERTAAFALSYSVGGLGPGRIIDTLRHGGPRLEPIYTYPTPGPGVLTGQGAGYKEWNRSGSLDTITTAGVGMDFLPGGSPGLGRVPITEGQIDTGGMVPGTYVLKVTPGGGNNVLRGDIDLSLDQPAFAVAANQTIGDEITFTLIPEPATMMLLAIVGMQFSFRRSRR